MKGCRTKQRVQAPPQSSNYKILKTLSRIFGGSAYRVQDGQLWQKLLETRKKQVEVDVKNLAKPRRKVGRKVGGTGRAIFNILCGIVKDFGLYPESHRKQVKIFLF